MVIVSKTMRAGKIAFVRFTKAKKGKPLPNMGKMVMNYRMRRYRKFKLSSPAETIQRLVRFSVTFEG
jgi:hypothetical protein